MLLLAALLQRLLGPSGAQATIAVGGLIDTHAATASAARLASSGTLAPAAAAFAAMLAITAQHCVKAVAAAVIIVLWVAWFLKDLWTP